MSQLDVRQLIKLHRAQFLGLTELRGVNRLRPIYEKSRAELETQLADLVAHGKGQTFTAQHLRIVLAQVLDVLKQFNGDMTDHLRKQGELAQRVSARHVIQEVKVLEKHFTGMTPVIQTEQAAVLQGVYKDVTPSLLNRFKRSEMLYTKPVVRDIRNALATSIIKGETLDAAVDRVAGTDGVFAGARWRAERIARTELSFVYGATKQRTLEELKTRDVPDLKKKLIETLDNRTGEDSKELNGQVRDINEKFHYEPPPGKKGYPDFLQPPGRPNDRAVVVSWRAGWSEKVVGSQGAVDPSAPAG